MRRRRRITRVIFRGFATVAIGGALGFLVPTVVSDLTPQPEVVSSTVPESPVARRFINAFAADDQDTLTALNVTADVKLRASRFAADFARVDQPIHLGSFVTGGGLTLHSYAAHAVGADGTETMLGWRVVTSGGEIGIIDPPGMIEEP
jgi:hypothetical protein